MDQSATIIICLWVNPSAINKKNMTIMRSQELYKTITISNNRNSMKAKDIPSLKKLRTNASNKLWINRRTNRENILWKNVIRIVPVKANCLRGNKWIKLSHWIRIHGLTLIDKSIFLEIKILALWSCPTRK